jgi:hypothetical protein
MRPSAAAGGTPFAPAAIVWLSWASGMAWRRLLHTLDTPLDTTTDSRRSSRGANLRALHVRESRKRLWEAKPRAAELFSWMPEEGLEPPTRGL